MNTREILINAKKATIESLFDHEISDRQVIVYNRNAAKAYAEAYALSPNTKQYPLFKDDDCTNFISQVLRAGGMMMIGNDYTKFQNWFCYTNNPRNLAQISLTWRSARYFRRHWGNENGIGSNAAREYKEMKLLDAIANFQGLYNILEIGDVIQYGDPKKGNLPYHTQVIHAKGYNTVKGRNDLFMAQHTANRKNVSLYEYFSLLKDKDRRRIYIYRF
ncbi:amidase domain-containing protein [Clostridium sp.]|uniref:amidase domain-containing protein n=1 Tax=Clostridium sp. TaxID=1506 RepID=UPI002FCB5055